jgi:multimeric flavodoxin WrbA
MAQTVVVVTFYSRGGATERLATAAAVGAVQARAGIRMRRLADADPAATIQRHPEAQESLIRMHREYVPPREADVLAADALVFGLPDGMTPASAECSGYFDMLARLGADGKLAGKAAAAVGGGATVDAITRALSAAGLMVVTMDTRSMGDGIEAAIALGRRVVAAAESRRRAST